MSRIIHSVLLESYQHFFTNFATKAKKANPPNLAKPKPNQDQFLLQQNFSHLILHTFVTLPHQDCLKTMTSLFHKFCYQGTKANPPNLAKPKANQDQFLLQPNFSHLILHTFVTLPDGRGPSTTSHKKTRAKTWASKAKPRASRAKKGASRPKGGGSRPKGGASRPKGGASRPSEFMKICICYMKAH